MTWVLPFAIRIIVPMFIIGIIAGIYATYQKVVLKFPRIKLNEKFTGYLFMVLMILLLIGVFTWPFMFPKLYAWLDNTPQWIHDWFGPR